jgi:hypothetical protein
MTTEDAEMAALGAISTSLAAVEDQEARERVLAYAVARFAPNLLARAAPRTLPIVPGKVGSPSVSTLSEGLAAGPGGTKEIPGVARLTEAGDLKVTIRDLKAKSGLDAAARLAIVSIYAYNQLAGQAFSSSKGLTPILKQWRLYDGNTRRKLAAEKGILRDGDGLTLDAHAERDAVRMIEEIREPSVEGTWKPSR